MKVLVVFLLAVLGCSPSEGGVLSKCDLKNQLVKATANLTLKAMPKGLTVDNLVLKIVCHAEHVSGFNTSVVKELADGKEGNNSRAHKEPTGNQNNRPEIHSGVHNEPTGDQNKHNGKGNLQKNHTGSNQPHSRHRRHDKVHSPQTRPTSPPHPAHNCTLYGIFQLSSCQVCSNGTTPSANLCGMDCSKLLDDNVSDDISCLLKILSLTDNRVGEKDINKLLLKENCENVNASTYFAGCSS